MYIDWNEVESCKFSFCFEQDLKLGNEWKIDSCGRIIEIFGL